MEFDITAKIGKVNFSPANEIEEIIQNVKTVLTTIKGAVVLDRNFGINADILDLPIPVMQAKLSVEIIESIEKYPNNLSLIVLFVNTSILVFKFVTLFTTILQNFSVNN